MSVSYSIKIEAYHVDYPNAEPLMTMRLKQSMEAQEALNRTQLEVHELLSRDDIDHVTIYVEKRK